MASLQSNILKKHPSKKLVEIFVVTFRTDSIESVIRLLEIAVGRWKVRGVCRFPRRILKKEKNVKIERAVNEKMRN